jgi:hypothetical protein
VLSTRNAWSAGVVAFALSAGAVATAESKQKAFENDWVRRHVVVRQALYSLVYKERSLRGSVEGKRDGLTVVTPFAGTYFQFDGRHRVDDVTEHDVQRIAESVKSAYLKSKVLEEGTNQVIDPVMVARYDRGTELIVRAAHVNRETVRLELSLPADTENDLATTLTIQWPTPLSKSFSERGDVEDLIQQFLTTRQ